MTDNLPDDLITIEEAARIAGVDIEKLRAWVYRRVVPSYRRGHERSLYVSRADVEPLGQFRPASRS